MNEVLKKAGELVEVLTLRIRHYEQSAHAATQAASESVTAKRVLDGKIEALATKEQAVAARETAVGQIESLQALEQSVNGAKTALAASQEKFANEQAATLKTLKDAQDALAAARVKLSEREKKLDEDRKAYKLNTMKQLIEAGWTGPKSEE